jgi:hypothetical protein
VEVEEINGDSFHLRHYFGNAKAAQKGGLFIPESHQKTGPHESGLHKLQLVFKA